MSWVVALVAVLVIAALVRGVGERSELLGGVVFAGIVFLFGLPLLIAIVRVIGEKLASGQSIGFTLVLGLFLAGLLGVIGLVVWEDFKIFGKKVDKEKEEVERRKKVWIG